MCDRVGVLYAGKMVEEGGRAASSRDPATPTRSGSCAASPAAGYAEPKARWTRSPATCPSPGARCRLRLRRSLSAGRRPLPRGGARRSYESGRRSSRAATSTSAARALPRVEPPAEVGTGDRRTGNGAAILAAGEVSKTFQRAATTFQALVEVSTLEICAPARPSGWSASRAAARRRWPKTLLGVDGPDAGARVDLDGASSRRRSANRRRDESAPSRSSSRTPTRR